MNLPKHIAIIPDGNRRWARERGLPAFEGHRRGFERALEISKKAREVGITVLTFWAFSTDNWKRSKEEVTYLMKLYEAMIDKNLKEALKEQTRIVHLGRKDRINDSLRRKITQAEEKTVAFTRRYLCIALDYGGRDEIVRGIQRFKNDDLARLAKPSARQGFGNIDEENFAQFLDTKDLPYPNVDLIIRTSGEQRTSGLLPWQATYAEYIFSDKHFPDFTEDDFEACVKEYQKRQRRFGT